MSAPHVFVSWTIQDAKGKKSTTEMKLPAAADIAIASTFARSTGVMIDALIKGRLVDVAVGIKIALSSLSGIKTVADPDSDVEEGARFQFSTAIDSLTGFRLPTFDEAFMVAGTALVDTADATVDALVQRVIAGQTVGLINVSPSDQYGNDVTTLESASDSFTSTRR